MEDHVQTGPAVVFTDRERQLIAAAERRIRNALCFRCVCALMLLTTVGLYVAGYMAEDHMVMFALGIIFAALIYPHWGARTPSYEQLVDMLVDKSSAGRRDPLKQALSSKKRFFRLRGKRLRL